MKMPNFSKKFIKISLFALIAILVVNVIALAVLVIFDGDRYEKEAKRIEQQLINIYEDQLSTVSRTLYVTLFDASTFIVLDKDSSADTLRFMEPALREQIKAIRGKQQGRILLLWVKGNHTLVHYHDCIRISPYWNIAWSEHIFAGNDYVRLRAYKTEVLEKNVKTRQLRIQ